MDNIKSNIDMVLKNQYVMMILKVSLVLYASQLAPTLPSSAQALLKNTFVRIVAVILIAYFAEVDFQVAIMLGVIYVLSLNVISGRGLLESYEDQGPYYSDQTQYQNLLQQPALVGNATLLDAQTDNYSGCDSITMNDLLTAFDNDHVKLQNSVQFAFKDLLNTMPNNTDSKTRLISLAKACGLPGNIKFDDASAPFIATILLNFGFKISPTCQPPNGPNMFSPTIV
jgi:hypothetical protein